MAGKATKWASCVNGNVVYFLPFAIMKLFSVHVVTIYFCVQNDYLLSLIFRILTLL